MPGMRATEARKEFFDIVIQGINEFTALCRSCDKKTGRTEVLRYDDTKPFVNVALKVPLRYKALALPLYAENSFLFRPVWSVREEL